MRPISIKDSWDAIARRYQRETRISTDDVHYGALIPGERELKLLGDVKGCSILELGCGGGQNAIALAKWGAQSAGLDLSEEQIRFARTLADSEGVSVPFFNGSMEDLSLFPDGSQDIVLSSFALAYIENIDAVFSEVYRVLREGGVFVFADLHPLASRGRIIRVEGKTHWTVGDYFRRGKMRWLWPGLGRGATSRFYSFHRTLEDYFEGLFNAGFRVERVLEPRPLGVQGRGKNRVPCFAPVLMRGYATWRRIPYSVIFKARKTNRPSS
jgi:ubiquinone/menaquinone biosynthesis C-methylase UbiE